ncbi:arsenate reductase ArsC [Arenicella chitinivorans]|uniref:arsenate reductase ArsC n=1 Tax=Arenicella chitinivorans TaxID=1329800 RepID=UPI00167345C3
MRILFICTHNRCRSILAEAIANQRSGGRLLAASAGSAPQGEVHPLSLAFLAQHGLTTTGLSSQSWHEFEDFKPHAILTLCDSAAKESCPVWFGESTQVHWGIPDPSKQIEPAAQKNAFNHTIDVLARRIQALSAFDVAENSAALKQRLLAIAAQHPA